MCTQIMRGVFWGAENNYSRRNKFYADSGHRCCERAQAAAVLRVCGGPVSHCGGYPYII
jgi:hypothetical protein